MKFLCLIWLTVCSCCLSVGVRAQCSICTRTAQQMGEGPAKGLNAGIIYLAFTPLLIGGFVGYRWWNRVKDEERENRG